MQFTSAFDLQFITEEKIHTKAVVDDQRRWWKGFPGEDQMQNETMVSYKTTPEDLHLKSRSKVNPSVTNDGYLYCSILKALYGFKEKRGHKVSSLSKNLK